MRMQACTTGLQGGRTSESKCHGSSHTEADQHTARRDQPMELHEEEGIPIQEQGPGATENSQTAQGRGYASSAINQDILSCDAIA